MTPRRSCIPLTVLVPALLLAAAGNGEPAERRGIERTEEFLVLRVKAPFQEVLATLEAAVARRNYFLVGTNHLDDTLRRRAADLGTSFDYDHYKIVSFCSLTLADEALRAEPAVGAFMPCRLALYVRKGSPEVVIVTLRPTFLARVFKSKEMTRLAEVVENDLLEILRMVAAE